ncbi:hypothetical protein GCM10009123_14530 [Kangiella japonica]|uniref:Ubiquinone biosynthesis monooxygenase Coq7 n=1 Tax=Kangiella japonica TaxID=647384 RepID=A0ABN0T085_9GAMM
MEEEVHRILRVDHAGETGAIQIYKAQIAVSRILYPEIVPTLSEMLAHESEHFKTFDALLKKRGIRHCYALGLWALGGMLLGFITALLGKNSIWVCTNAIETTVLNHLKHQLEFLKSVDKEAHEAVLSIKTDEESHQRHGASSQKPSFLNKPIFGLVSVSTAFAIWLSTKL